MSLATVLHTAGVSVLVALGMTPLTSPALVAGLMADGMNGRTTMLTEEQWRELEDEKGCERGDLTDREVWEKLRGVEQMKNALDVQIGGEHYKKWKIQPAEFCHVNSIPFLEGNVVKYVIRHRDKNRLQDLRKAKHYLELIAEMEYGVML